MASSSWDRTKPNSSRVTFLTSTAGTPLTDPGAGAEGHSAPTRFIEANGIRFAYRRFGKAGGRCP